MEVMDAEVLMALHGCHNWGVPMAEKWGPALPLKPLPVNGLFAALPQIEVVVPQIERNWAAHDQAPPQTSDGFGATNSRAFDNGPAWTISKPGQ
jgi:hypothetical protein